MNRNEMIKWLSENTTREQWLSGFELPKFKTTLHDTPWMVYNELDGYCVAHMWSHKGDKSTIKIDDVFEPVSEQPVYIDGGIYEIGVMNGEPQQFVYNLKLNMFERGSNESIGASNVHDSKIVTHFKLVSEPERITDREAIDTIRREEAAEFMDSSAVMSEPEGLLNHARGGPMSQQQLESFAKFGNGGTHLSSVLDKQEGGSHYKGKGVQPWEIIKSNDMGFFDGNALKYLMRHRDKNGAEDIKKAIHYLEAILEFEYNVRR